MGSLSKVYCYSGLQAWHKDDLLDGRTGQHSERGMAERSIRKGNSRKGWQISECLYRESQKAEPEAKVLQRKPRTQARKEAGAGLQEKRQDRATLQEVKTKSAYGGCRVQSD